MVIGVDAVVELLMLMLLLLRKIGGDTADSGKGLRVDVIDSQSLASHGSFYLMVLVADVVHWLEVAARGGGDHLLAVSEALSDLRVGATAETLVLKGTLKLGLAALSLLDVGNASVVGHSGRAVDPSASAVVGRAERALGKLQLTSSVILS